MLGDNEYFLESALKEKDALLFKRFTNTVAIMPNVLTHYEKYFPHYTDHSILHALNVISFANSVIGQENVEKMNAEEIFVFLLGCYLHDSGMGISKNDYYEFIEKIDTGDYFKSHDKDNLPVSIRKFHHELSAQFAKKYAMLFELDDPAQLFAVMQIAKGHRVTNLMDDKEFPVDFVSSSGNRICLPYLGAIIRLADEIDVAKNRNPEYMYEMVEGLTEKDIIEFGCHKLIKSVDVCDSVIRINILPVKEELKDALKEKIQKMQYTLDECRKAVNGRTKYCINQSLVLCCPVSEG